MVEVVVMVVTAGVTAVCGGGGMWLRGDGGGQGGGDGGGAWSRG